MRGSFRLGHVAGIGVSVNWSVVVVFLLVFWGAMRQYPTLFPDLSTLAYGVAAAIAAGLFFASLLLHELAHAVVARRNGVGVAGISLWLFGGMARFTSESPSAGAELRIAGVGPLVNLVLAVVAVGGSLLLGGLGVTGITLGVLVWLGIVNLALAVFNLAPAAPLDGGRILRALLWMRGKDQQSATITAARAGRVFGLLLVCLGLVAVVTSPGLDGLWLMLIGWFIASAAQVEARHAKLRQTLGGLQIREVMTPQPPTVHPEVTVDRLLEDLPPRVSAVVVVDADGRPQGLVLLDRIKAVDSSERHRVPVRALAGVLDEVRVLAPSQRLADVLASLQAADRDALVVDDGHLVGILSRADVTRVVERTARGGDADRFRA